MMELVIFEGVIKTVIYSMLGIFGMFLSIKRIFFVFLSIILFEIEIFLDFNEYKLGWLLTIIILRNIGKKLIEVRQIEEEE